MHVKHVFPVVAPVAAHVANNLQFVIVGAAGTEHAVHVAAVADVQSNEAVAQFAITVVGQATQAYAF